MGEEAVDYLNPQHYSGDLSFGGAYAILLKNRPGVSKRYDSGLLVKRLPDEPSLKCQFRSIAFAATTSSRSA